LVAVSIYKLKYRRLINKTIMQILEQIISTLGAVLIAVQATVAGVPASTQLAQVTPLATMSVSPLSASHSVNDTFQVSVSINTSGQSAYGVDINKLRFNPSVLQVVDSDANTSGVQISAGSLMPLTILNSVDNTAGTVQFSQLASPGSTYSGTGTLATITFRVVSAGSSSLNFDFTLGSGSDTNIAGLGGDLLLSVSNGSYTGIALDTTPPTISSVSVSNITQNSAVISWSTNEASDTQVNYGLTSSYGNSTTLNSSMVTSHSVTITGLSAGMVYHYRVRSRDAAGNLTSSSDNTFTTQTLPDTTAPNTPTGLSAIPTSETEIQLSWNVASDPSSVGQNVSGISHYRIFRGGALIATTSSTAYLDVNLSAGTQYTYQIEARDNAGNTSSKSSSVSATTPILSLPVQRRIIINLEGAPSNRRDVTGTIKFLNPSNISSEVYQASITTNTSGQYIVDIPEGLIPTVTLRPVVVGYLSKLVPNVDLRNSSVLDVATPTLLAGDFNGDGIINSLDFSQMNGRWGQSDQLIDINRDGTVNSLDFAYISNNWLKTGE
jgi:fibronectin type 3 domain-containing protein